MRQRRCVAVGAPDSAAQTGTGVGVQGCAITRIAGAAPDGAGTELNESTKGKKPRRLAGAFTLTMKTTFRTCSSDPTGRCRR
jgi:hypothetical protein